MKLKSACVFSMVAMLSLAVAGANAAGAGKNGNSNDLWQHGNLVATLVHHFDAKARGPEERAQMLKSLGFTKYAHNWRPSDVPTFDAEIDALQRYGIELHAWMLYGSDNPNTQVILDTFRRHGVHPPFWVYPSGAEQGWLYPSGLDLDLEATPQQRRQRVIEETDKIMALRKQAAPYGVKIILYNHNGWFGMVDNQLAIISRLKELGVTDVGMVYNFAHARDKVHDDSTAFPALWAKMKDHVLEVNIQGMALDGKGALYPSQGDGELDMLRTIQQSGWRGPIGLAADKGGDAEITLRNCLVGLDWLAAELQHTGSAGPRPFTADAGR